MTTSATVRGASFHQHKHLQSSYNYYHLLAATNLQIPQLRNHGMVSLYMRMHSRHKQLTAACLSAHMRPRRFLLRFLRMRELYCALWPLSRCYNTHAIVNTNCFQSQGYSLLCARYNKLTNHKRPLGNWNS